MNAVAAPLTISVDTSGFERQLTDLRSSLERFPDGVSGRLFDLIDLSGDLVRLDPVPADSTGCTLCFRLLFGVVFEKFAAALRAGQFDALCVHGKGASDVC